MAGKIGVSLTVELEEKEATLYAPVAALNVSTQTDQQVSRSKALSTRRCGQGLHVRSPWLFLLGQDRRLPLAGTTR